MVNLKPDIVVVKTFKSEYAQLELRSYNIKYIYYFMAQ